MNTRVSSGGSWLAARLAELLCGTLLVGCSGGSDNRKSANIGTTADRDTGRTVVVVQNTTVATQAESNAGTLKGTQVAMPIGSLTRPGVVEIDTAAQPEGFGAIDSDLFASSAFRVTASFLDGEEVFVLQQPMVIAIPYDQPPGNTLIQEEEPLPSISDLCVVLDADGEDGRYLWRDAVINVDEVANEIYFETTKLGTFQAVYCGDSLLEGFIDALIAGLTDGQVEQDLLEAIPDVVDTDYESQKPEETPPYNQ